jgi:hypothetical protein
MFAQFRAQYPQGSIKTEMLPKVDGLHVFRVTVEHSGTVLSTATAADTDIELTEDRAVKRALVMAGVSFDDNYGMQATLMPQSANNLASSAMSRKNTEALPASNQATMHFDEQLDLVQLGSNNYQNNNYESGHTYYEEPEYEPISETSTSSSPKLSAKPTAVTAPVPEPAVVKPTESFDSPIDLSDPIAQIDVEMERLAWDRNMGRGYLQKAFNKRSRQQLSDSELIQFLTHLKSLPTPTQL